MDPHAPAIPKHLIEGYAPPHGSPLATIDLGGGRHARAYMEGRELRHARYVEGRSGALYDERAPSALIEAIEGQLALPAAQRGEIRIFLGDRDSGADWLSGHNARGVLARPVTFGPAPAPQRMPRLAIAEPGQNGILTELPCECIVRLTLDGQQLYRHPDYHFPAIVGATGDRSRPFGVFADGAVRAFFTTEAHRYAWLAFMEGSRPTPTPGEGALAIAADDLRRARLRVERMEALGEVQARHPIPQLRPEPASAPLAGGQALVRRGGLAR